jgi:formamidopyrimidine-DNA glycosylase
MPEGAEVAQVAIRLHERISGSWIYNIKINEKSRYNKPGKGSDFLNNIKDIDFPIFISRIYPKGKKIIFECVNPCTKSKVYLVSLLAMTGRWQYTPGKHSGVWLTLWKNSTQSSVFFDDQRHFGSLVICVNETDLNETLKGVGPDLLNEHVEFEDYKNVITQKRIAKKEICAFLLEQKYFSGIGNWVRAEVLYGAKIAPQRTLESLNENEIYLVYYYSIKVLREAYKVRGLTIENYIDPDGEYGTYEVKVYMQDKDPFGNEVVRNVFSDKRTMHWVPSIQK